MDTLDKVEQIKKYLKYGLLLIPVIVILIILLKGCNSKSYSTLESNVKSAVLTYVKDKNLTIVGEQYIELSDLEEIEGTELCSASSGAIVKNENGVLTVTPYLDCEGYKSKSLKSEGKYITLNGDAIMLLNRGEVFNDPLYTLKRDADVEVDGIVGSGVGVYTISYGVNIDYELKETLYRKVIVTSGDRTKKISGIENMTEPTLTLYGDTEIVLAKGEKYVEPGYKAIDYTDGKITRQVVVTGKVDINKAGSYPIIYSVTNSKGNITVKKRIVNVVLRKANLNIDLKVTDGISNTAIITMNVGGENFSHLELPDGTSSVFREAQYQVKQNKDYTFYAYDIYGNRFAKEVTVDNIDTIPPTATCKALVKYKSTSVTVEASDNKGIGGYKYIIGDKKTDFIESNTYELAEQSKSVKVIVKDIAGNTTNQITCEIEEKVNDPDGIRILISGKPKLQIPVTQALAANGYTVDDFNKCIYDRVVEAGPGTRYGVVAAAYGLIDCNLKLTGKVLSYDHTGGKIHVDPDGKTNYCTFNSSICGKLGINVRWGTAGGACKMERCYYGLNCATFVRWSMCNGGMDLCDRGTAGAFSMSSKTYFPEADGVVINGSSVKYYSGTDLTSYTSAQLVRMLKPGDIASRERNGDPDGSSQHTFVIIGRDETGIYAANDGYYVDKISYSSMTKGEYYYRLLFLDKYYENENNRNNLYN